MKLTIGMAVYDDYDGMFFSLESLRLYHGLDRYQAEIVIVDNHPDGDYADDIRHYVSAIHEVPARLIPLREPVGTSAPRDLIFRVAQGEWVMVIDSHVLIAPKALEALLAFADEHSEPAIIHGPLVAYDRKALWTHFDPIWRDGMWGIWGTDPRGAEAHLPPFEIPAMGLGLFVCRRQHWPGFHPMARGFGGEECYIHEKLRQRGGRVYCLPGLRWVHRFHNPKRATAYPNLWRDRIRNYMLEYIELNRDLQELKDHFTVEKPVLTPAEFDALYEQCRAECTSPTPLPAMTTTPPPLPLPTAPDGTTALPTTDSGCGCRKPRVHFQERNEWFTFERAHSTLGAATLETIAEFARQCPVVVACTATAATAAACLSTAPQRYVAISDEDPRWWWPQATAVRGHTEMTYLKADPRKVRFPQCDCLIVAGIDRADDVLHILRIYAPARRAIIIGTQLHGGGEMSADGRGPGLLPGLRLWVRRNPQWVVVRHVADGPGVTVLSAVPDDRPNVPGAWRMVATFAKAVAQHVASGAQYVTREILEERLNICAICDRRTVGEDGRERCSVCGCYLTGGVAGAGGKAEWASQDCPLGKWPAPNSGVHTSEKASVT